MYSKKLASILVLAVFMGVSLPAFAAETMTLSLAESINLALKNNNKIKSAERGTEIAKWNLEKSKGEKALSVDLSHTASRIGGEYWKVFYINESATNYFVNSASASLPLYSGGRIENIIKQAKLGSEMSVFHLQDTKQALKFQVTQAYYTILASQNFQQVKEVSVNQLKEHLKNVKAQYAVGTVTKADVLRSEVELANATQALVTAKNNTQFAISMFNRIVGLPIQNTVEVKDSLSYEQHNYQLEECISYALTNRPDLIVSQKAVKQAEAGVKVAEAGKKLNLSFGASYNTYDTKTKETDTKQWTAGITAHVNLFDGNVTKAAINASKGVLDQAKHQRNDMQAEVELGVQQAYLNLIRAESNISTNKVAVDKAAEDFSLAQARYSVNLGTNLDVVDAQVALTAAKMNYIQSLYDYNISKAALDKAMGKAVN